MRILDASVAEAERPTSTTFRRPTPGPEYDLLMAFIARGLPSPDVGERLAVFIEPRLETGCPDAVAAYWRPAPGPDQCTLSRLRPIDDRVMHLVWLEPGIDTESIESRYGPQVAGRARELAVMGLIDDCESRMTVPHERVVLSRLIAVEAKVAGPASALRQATRNTWYASESYVLMPAVPTAQSLSEKYAACGVGIVTPDDVVDSPSLSALNLGLPQSHVTWRFNRLAMELTAAGVC